MWERYCTVVLRRTAYSALAVLYMGRSGSAFFQSVKNSSYDFRAALRSRMSAYERANCRIERAPITPALPTAG